MFQGKYRCCLVLNVHMNGWLLNNLYVEPCLLVFVDEYWCVRYCLISLLIFFMMDMSDREYVFVCDSES